jgi:phosphatidylinositol-3-phosphatase
MPITFPRWFSSLVWIVFENHGYEEVAQLPSHQRLAKHGAVLTNHVAIQHPSGPNYRSLAAGDPVSNEEVLPGDQQVQTFAGALRDSLVEIKQFYVPWRGDSAARHQPFNDCKQPLESVVYAPGFFESLPAMAHVYLGLDDINNSHSSGTLDPADAALNALLDTLDSSKWFQTAVNGLFPALFVVWDEAFANPNNHVFAAWYGRGVKAGSVDTTLRNHFSFCRTVTDNYWQAALAHARGVTPMKEVFG